MYGEMLQKIKVYLQKTRPLFKNGFLRLLNENNKIKLMYKTSFGEFTTKQTINLEKEDVIENVVDFTLDCFFYYEWNGESLKSEDLSLLLGVAPSTARWILFKIYNKIRDVWESILP